ncbi:MAG: hypothetical protein FIA98_06915 [Anaerolineae bacterium]|nr:hypothetical protein [Anaerolineae bacterium]
MLISIFPNSSSDEGERQHLAAWITRVASKQTYYTLRWLADKDRLQRAFRAYAYFRWVDDWLDSETGTQQDKLAFVVHQQSLLDACYRGEPPAITNLEEQMLLDLVDSDPDSESGLSIYLHNMMQVMTFDVDRRGRLISQAELAEYSQALSRAVTEYMFYFFGHDQPPPQGPTRYHAVVGAHMVHMLRDMVCDIDLGYYNAPREILSSEALAPEDLHKPAVRRWIYERARLAHEYFETGRAYVSTVKSLRCRLAGFAYLARFEWMLKAIERNKYCLKADYPERKKFKVFLWIAVYVIKALLRIRWRTTEPVEIFTLSDQCEE